MSDLVRDLERKIDLQRSVHSFHEIRTRRIGILVQVSLIVFPAFLTLAALSDFEFLQTFFPVLTEEILRLAIGFLSLILFLVAVISDVFNIVRRPEKHRDAIEQYTQLLGEIREATKPLHPDQEKLFSQRYFSISSNAIPTSSSGFIRAEKAYLREAALREAAKENPFGSYFKTRLRAEEIAKNKANGRQ